MSPCTYKQTTFLFIVTAFRDESKQYFIFYVFLIGIYPPMREEFTARVGQRYKTRSPIRQNFRFSLALPNYVTVNVNIKQLFVQTYAYRCKPGPEN